MSNKISSKFEFEIITLEKNKKIAIDLMPLLYQYLYLGDMKSPEGPLRKGEIITSYIYQTLLYLKKLTKLDLEVFVCLDGSLSKKKLNLKSEVSKKRMESRQNKIESYKLKIETDQMSSLDWFRYNCAKYFITPANLELLKQILLKLGYKVILLEGFEAEAIAAYLKEKNIVDYCYSVDKDITLYGVDALVHLEPNSGSSLFFDNAKNKKKLLINQEQLILAATVSGTDYSPGILRMGPVKAIEAVKKPEFEDEAKKILGVSLISEIRKLFTNQELNLTESSNLKKILENYQNQSFKNLPEVAEILKDLDFSEKSLKKILYD